MCKYKLIKSLKQYYWKLPSTHIFNIELFLNYTVFLFMQVVMLFFYAKTSIFQYINLQSNTKPPCHNHFFK